MKHIFKIYIDNFDIEFEYSGNHYRLSWDHYGVLIFCNFGIWNVAKNRCKKLKVYPSAVFYHEYLHIIWFIRRLHCLDCILYIYWERLSSLTDELWKWTVIVARRWEKGLFRFYYLINCRYTVGISAFHIECFIGSVFFSIFIISSNGWTNWSWLNVGTHFVNLVWSCLRGRHK